MRHEKMAHGYADIAMRRYRAGPLNILIFKSWQVFDGLAKWLIIFGFMDLR